MFNVNAVKRGHQLFAATLDREIKAVTDAARLTELAQRYVATNRPPRSITGELVKKTKIRVVRAPGGRLLKIQNSADHAAAQDGGSGIHGPRRRKYEIRPKRPGGALRFVVGGKIVFARKVMHPGVRPTRFLFNAADGVGRTVGTTLQSSMHRASRAFARQRA